MSAYEQRVEPPDKKWQYLLLLLNHMRQYHWRWAPLMEPPDKKWQYLLFAAEPYEIMSFKVSTPPWNPLIKSGSICCLLLNHMRQYHSRWAPPPMEPPDKKWQYLLFAAEPYEIMSFKVSTPPWNPLIKSGSICCLLLNHMRQYHSRWAPPPPHGAPW